MTTDILLNLLGMAGVGVGVYAGIRADIARLHERVESALHAAHRAHERIDHHFDVGR